MSKIIPFSQLVQAQHLNFLEHKRREYQEREDYLARLRRLLFQVEGQMRQAEVLQLELYQQAAKHFQAPLEFPSQHPTCSLPPDIGITQGRLRHGRSPLSVSP